MSALFFSHFRAAFCLLWCPSQKHHLSFTLFGSNDTEISLSPKFFWKDIQPWARGGGVGHLPETWQFCLRLCVWRSLGCGGAVPWQINHYKVISEMLSFLCFCDAQTTFLSSFLSPSSSPSLNPAHLCGSVLGPLLPPLSPSICVSGADSAVGKPPAKLGSLQCFGQICLSNLTHLLSLLKISSVPLIALLPLS